MSNLLRPTIGDNILAQHPFLHNRQAVYDHVRRANSAAEVIMDDWTMTTTLAREMPATLFVDRAYHIHDQSFHTEGYDPVQVVNGLNRPVDEKGNPLPNFYNQLFNEPSGYVNVPQLVNYTVACMDLARNHGKRLMVLNHGVWHPNVDLIRRGVYDPILLRLADGFHGLGQHEYWIKDPLAEKDQVGRVLEFIKRAQVLGIQRPLIVITEAGRDIRGGEDGYRSVPLSAEEYWRLLKLQQSVYALYGIPMCVFCLGEGARDKQYPEGRWKTYDYQNDPYILRSMESFNLGVQLPMTTPVPLPPNTPTWQATIIEPAGPINVRNAPSTTATLFGQVSAGPAAYAFAEVSAYPDWYWIETSAFKGWINKLKGFPVPLKLEPVLTELVADPCPWTKEQLLKMANLHTEMSMIFTEMADQL